MGRSTRSTISEKIILTATVRFYGIVTEKDVNTYDPSKAKTTIETSEAIDSLEIP
jgi:hypothetical protein